MAITIASLLGSLALVLAFRVVGLELAEKDLRAQLERSLGARLELEKALAEERTQRQKLVEFANRQVGREGHLAHRVNEQSALITSLTEQLADARDTIDRLDMALGEATVELEMLADDDDEEVTA